MSDLADVLSGRRALDHYDACLEREEQATLEREAALAYIRMKCRALDGRYFRFIRPVPTEDRKRLDAVYRCVQTDSKDRWLERWQIDLKERTFCIRLEILKKDFTSYAKRRYLKHWKSVSDLEQVSIHEEKKAARK